MKSNQMLLILKRELEAAIASTGMMGADVKRNAAKEILQYFVLDFIFHHPRYRQWIMYGGAALRICHGLDRMSVDLDFEVDHEVDDSFLHLLKTEIAEHFQSTYDVGSDLLTIGVTNNRGLVLKFHVGEELGLSFHSKQVHIKVDLNHFVIRPKIVTEHWPQNKYQRSFVINTYNMSALMASKIAAIFLRGERGVGDAVYSEKGRDIYDLLWYMGKKTVPDLDYLHAKHVEETKDLRTLFDQLTIKMNAVSAENLKQDLTPLFADQKYIQDWINHWFESYMRLLDEYQIHKVTALERVTARQDSRYFFRDVYSVIYEYHTEEGELITITYRLGDEEANVEKSLPNEISDIVRECFELEQAQRHMRSHSRDRIMQYAELFYQKTEDYLKKTNRVLLGDTITTKLIRMTVEDLDQKEQIFLYASALRSCGLEDLLK